MYTGGRPHRSWNNYKVLGNALNSGSNAGKYSYNLRLVNDEYFKVNS
jgi:hypothetical protein